MPLDPKAGLLFVYAVDGGRLNTVLHVAHKLLRPETYPCSLCALTHGTLTPRAPWTQFLKQLELPAEFLHRDEFRQRHPSAQEALPAVFMTTPTGLKPLVSASEVGSCTDVQAFIAMLQDRLPGAGQRSSSGAQGG